MKIAKAVITAAAPDQHRLPLQRFVDLEGDEKTALEIILEEVVGAGIEAVCIVVRPGDHQPLREAAGSYSRIIEFVEQPQPRGYGDAVWRAAPFAAGEPVLHLVSDHLYISHGAQRCAAQLVAAAQQEQCAVSAVQATRESMLSYYGTVGGRRAAGSSLYEIEQVIEKPTPTVAEQRLMVPGLRAGHYLCLFGMHVLTAAVMDILGHQAARANGEPLLLSPALDELARQERYLAMELDGVRFNIGVKYGILVAQLALALNGANREEILERLVELLAGRQQGRA